MKYEEDIPMKYNATLTSTASAEGVSMPARMIG